MKTFDIYARSKRAKPRVVGKMTTTDDILHCLETFLAKEDDGELKKGWWICGIMEV